MHGLGNLQSTEYYISQGVGVHADIAVELASTQTMHIKTYTYMYERNQPRKLEYKKRIRVRVNPPLSSFLCMLYVCKWAGM